MQTTLRYMPQEERPSRSSGITDGQCLTFHSHQSKSQAVLSTMVSSGDVDLIGMCHQKIQQYDDALENYKKAIHYEPMNGRFLYHRAYIYSLLE